MAKDSDVSGTSQSKRPAFDRYDSSDQAQHLSQHHHRAKGPKHVVGGGNRLHARVPSSKALHKYHATASAAKLNHRRSLSPEREAETAASVAPPTHRRTTSDQKLESDALLANLLRNASQNSLVKRNRSHVDVGKKNKSSTNLKRSLSNPAVHKLKTSTGSKVHFNLGDDQDDDLEDGQEDEWVDASTSASPLLSRRGSTVSGIELNTHGQVGGDHSHPSSPLPQGKGIAHYGSPGGANGLAQSLNRGPASHKEYITARILGRTPSHGAPPMMSTATVSVRPGSSRQHSPDSGIDHNASPLSGTPGMVNPARPGSSGKQELTSRFVGHNSQEPGSGIPVDSFLTAVPHGGISRAAASGRYDPSGPRRPRSMGNLEQARGHTHDVTIGQKLPHEEAALTDEEDVDGGVLAVRSRTRRAPGYAASVDMSRTQQKLNLQRASSSLEKPQPPEEEVEVPEQEGKPSNIIPLITCDPRYGKPGYLLEKTGMEYLIVRRYQNPVARSLARLATLSEANKTRPIPRPDTRPGTRPGTAHSKRGSELGGGRASSLREREQSVATLIGGQSARRPATPRNAYSSRRIHSVSSSLDTDDDVSRIHERQRLSGSSLVNGEEDVGTIAMLRNMWERGMDLSASQD